MKFALKHIKQLVITITTKTGAKKNLSLVSRKKTKISLETLEETTKIQSVRRNQPAWE